MQAPGGATQAQADLRTAHTAPEQVAVTKARAASAEARPAGPGRPRTGAAQPRSTRRSGAGRRRRQQEVGRAGPGRPAGPAAAGARAARGRLWVTANFKETQLRRHAAGPAGVASTVDAYGRTYTGQVDSIAAATGARFSLLPPENATGNYVKVVQRVPVKIVLDQGQDPRPPAAARHVGRADGLHGR